MIKCRQNEARLYDIAESQQGLFTAKQAKACGYADNTIPYHVRVGHWIREQRGIYRLVRFPVTDQEQLVLWSLWSRNRQEKPQGVYSHSTALAIHDLSDVMPEKLHMTVPRTFRRFHEPPGILVIHKDDLAKDEIDARQGYFVTTHLRTLVDVAQDKSFPDDLLSQAVGDAFRTGMVSRVQLRAPGREIPVRLRDAIEEVIGS